MKKIRPCILTPEIDDIFDYHFRVLGKYVTVHEKKLLFDLLVADNVNFPEHEHMEVVLKAFFSALHYGSVELKGTNTRAHAMAFTEWLRARTSMRTATPEHSSCPPKPDNWQYDPNEPLPADISKAKAKQLMDIIAKLYEGELDRVINNSNFMHYVNKLKARYYE
jgi:hypothetical protein